MTAMSEPSVLEQLLDAAGAPFNNTKEILAEIRNEFESAKTEYMRVKLLELFKTIMDYWSVIRP
jgi:hypothetical protein